MRKNRIIVLPLKTNTGKEELKLNTNYIDKIVSFKKGDLINLGGQEAENLLILTEGIAQNIMQSEKEIGLRIFFAPCIINNIECILNPEKKEIIERDIKMRTIGEVIYINLKSFHKKLKDYNNITLPLINHLVFLRRQANKMIEEISFDGIEKKIGKFLILLAEERGMILNKRKNRKKQLIVEIYNPPNGREISELLNISRVSVSRILKLLENNKLLDRSFDSYRLLDYFKWKDIFKPLK